MFLRSTSGEFDQKAEVGLPIRPIRGLALAVVVFGVAGAVVASVAGLVLADTFRPHAPGADPSSLPAAVQGSDRWTGWHRRGTGSFLASAAISFLLLLWLVYGARVVKRNAFVVGASAAALVMAVVTVLTRGLVEWDQLALRAMTVGEDMSGYWFAGFGDDVLFVLVGNTEVSQGEYVLALMAHLGAPMVGGTALLIAGAALLRKPEPASGEA